MNEDMEKKLDQLLADIPKREYDLDAWLAEDETAEFDRIVSEQRASSGYDAGVSVAENGHELHSGSAAGYKQRPLWRWVAAAACFLLIIGVGLHYQFEKPVVTSDVTLGNTARYIRQQTPLPKVTSEPTPEPTPKPSTPQTDSGHTIAAPVRTPRTESPLPTEKDSAPYGKISASQDPNIHYASNDLTKDTIPYQDPARIDEFIAKLAAYNKVNEGELNCSAANDSSMVSAVYVFPDNDEIDVFGRLLQVACWYDSKTPGYLLNFSHQQFFFELKDLRKQLQYRWIAERVNGKILLYGTHAPLGAKESSACYQEYRNELMYQNSINIKTKKI
jgi:hypothetical protein